MRAPSRAKSFTKAQQNSEVHAVPGNMEGHRGAVETPTRSLDLLDERMRDSQIGGRKDCPLGSGVAIISLLRTDMSVAKAQGSIVRRG